MPSRCYEDKKQQAEFTARTATHISVWKKCQLMRSSWLLLSIAIWNISGSLQNETPKQKSVGTAIDPNLSLILRPVTGCSVLWPYQERCSFHSQGKQRRWHQASILKKKKWLKQLTSLFYTCSKIKQLQQDKSGDWSTRMRYISKEIVSYLIPKEKSSQDLSQPLEAPS